MNFQREFKGISKGFDFKGISKDFKGILKDFKWISKDFKFNVAGDSKNAFKIVPSFQRRWDGQDGIGEKSKDNFKVEFKYTF